MGKQWRHAVVGVGVVGEWHVKIVPHIEGSTLAAVCDTLPEKAQAGLAKNSLEAPVYSDIKQMLDTEQIDVVHICTPSGDHMDPAITAMEAGKNVICEKPLEIQLDRIDKMIEAARSNNVRLAGIFQNRWNQANRAIHDAAHAGRFGRIGYAGSFTPWYRTDQYYRDGGWRGTWKLDGGGAVMNQSVHTVDLLQWIAGDVVEVCAFAGSRIHAEIEVEDTLVCALRFASGAYGQIMGSTAMYPGNAVRVQIGGENGSAVSENGLKQFRFREASEEDAKLLEKLSPGSGSTGGGASATDVPHHNHLNNVKHILRSWEDGVDAETSGVEARKAVAIILAMYESAKNGGQPTPVK